MKIMIDRQKLVKYKMFFKHVHPTLANNCVFQDARKSLLLFCVLQTEKIS